MSMPITKDGSGDNYDNGDNDNEMRLAVGWGQRARARCGGATAGRQGSSHRCETWATRASASSQLNTSPIRSSQVGAVLALGMEVMRATGIGDSEAVVCCAVVTQRRELGGGAGGSVARRGLEHRPRSHAPMG
eukprot:2411977-Rhodomonas_salina.1